MVQIVPAATTTITTTSTEKTTTYTLPSPGLRDHALKMETDIPLYATSEKILIATSSFSLSVSIITELILCYMLTKGSSKVRTARSAPGLS